ncbi:hypothetical protein [Tautonia sociabilis]|uniref:CARDB domain-containing protein n=1 Tax=Tautonia sociabilis TaxID=2080755 RepID=A0A432MKR4_9BACT|nr:hypothetical protein [Tautonia sociabilis]RUL87725.1 hypothetical protein TsocGM_11100 [Tautonia sociabilis]
MSERHPRRGNSAKTRRRSIPACLEALEGRQLLAYSSLGFSIPDLAVADAFTGPVASLGGRLAVTVDVANLGQSSIPEPLNRFSGSTSTADAGETEVAVYLTSRIHSPFGQRVLLGTINVPAIPQNRLARVTGEVTLPETLPPGFQNAGGSVFLTVEVDPNHQVRDYDRTNNFFRPADAVTIVPDLPEVRAIALGLPPVMNPGDTIRPEVKVANFGAASTNLQGPVTVQIVASQDRNFGPGDIILGTFTVENIPALSLAPTKGFVPGDANLTDPPNVVRLVADQPVVLPDTGSPYYVGVVIDPLNEIQEISEEDAGPSSDLELPQLVADSGLGLPPAGVITIASPTDQPFPYPAFQTPTGTATSVSSLSGTNPVLDRAPQRATLASRIAAARASRRLPIETKALTESRVRPGGGLAARLAARRAMRGI